MNEPRNTCPTIDAYLKDLRARTEQIAASLREWLDIPADEIDMDDVKAKMRGAADGIEDLRCDIETQFEDMLEKNSDIREWGRFHDKRADELESKVSALEDEAADDEREMEKLSERIAELESVQ